MNLIRLDKFQDFEGMKTEWFGAIGTGYGKQTKLNYEEVLDLKDHPNPNYKAANDIVED